MRNLMQSNWVKWNTVVLVPNVPWVPSALKWPLGCHSPQARVSAFSHPITCPNPLAVTFIVWYPCVLRAQGPCPHHTEYRRQDNLNSLLPLCPSETLPTSSPPNLYQPHCLHLYLPWFPSVLSLMQYVLYYVLWPGASLSPLQSESLEWYLHTHGF